LEARTAFRAPEPDVLPEAVAEPGAPQAGVAAAEPDAQREAAAPDAAAGAVGPDAAGAAELDAQREAVAPDAAVVAEPDAQQAVVAVLDAQREAVAPDVAVAAEPDAQQEAAVAEASGARQVAAAASDVQRTVGPAVARPLVASVEPAETAAVRFWIPAMMVSAAALRPALVSAAKVQAAADR
jgi:ATP-dependent RNA helicase SUPV3L1/SUV3